MAIESREESDVLSSRNVLSSGIDYAKELNPEQYAAVTAPAGPALVLAGAGSGKTRTLTYRVSWLLDHGVQPWQILLLTFTNKAAKEMLERVESLTGVSSAQFWGGTFHSIGQRILRAHATKLGLSQNYNILDQSEAELLLADCIRSEYPRFLKEKENPKAGVIAGVISYSRNTCQSVAKTIEKQYPYFEEYSSKIEQFARLYVERKKKENVCDYDDLLEYWYILMRDHEEVRNQYQSKFRHILVDEYQDTNRLQSLIVDLMAGGHRSVTAVGDDAQCIYTWRGADFANIMEFPERYENAALFKIETNYRSSPEILAFANSVLLSQPVGRGYEKNLKAARESHSKPFVIQTVDPSEQAKFVVNQIVELHRRGRSLAEIAVLYRAHYHAVELQMELTRQGIPFQITSGIRFFEQAHVKDIISFIRFACNPSDSSSFRRFAKLIPKIGEVTAQKLHGMVYDLIEEERRSPTLGGGKSILSDAMEHGSVLKKIPAESLDAWKSVATSIQDIADAMEQGDAQQVVNAAMEGWYDDYMRTNFTNYLARRDDLDGLFAFAQQYSDIQDFLSQVVLLTSETADKNDGKANGESVRLTTIHQAKGLEFDHVFLIGLSQGAFPLKRSIESGDLEEERRLFYVGVTRARQELYLVYPAVTGGHGPVLRNEPSQFILEVPEEQYQMIRVRPVPRW
jgi:DNA helicase-2/ATP-dependent DNA helicase PcrA